MKHEAVVKINKFGKVTRVIALVCKILLIVGAAGALIGSIAMACLPKDLVTLSVSGDATVNVNLKPFGGVPEDQWSKIEEEIGGGDFNLNGQEYGLADVEVNADGILVNAKSEKFTYTLRDVIPFLIVGSVALAALAVVLGFIQALCKALRDCDSPFEDNVIKKMHNLAFALIPWAVLDTFAHSFLTSYFSGGPDFSLQVNMGTVIVILVILALSFVFKYGAVLQKESDETL